MYLIEKIQSRAKNFFAQYEIPKEFYTNVDFVFTDIGKIKPISYHPQTYDTA